MIFDNERLGTLLSDERIAPIAADAIRGWDMSSEPQWSMTLQQIRDENVFHGEIGNGIARLYRAADSGEWLYRVYSEGDRAEEPSRSSVDIVWLPSDDPAADERPFILVIPGGGFVNVWNLTEGWPIADRFNKNGYHAFVLTYRVDAEEKLIDKEMQDIAAALRYIKENEKRFHVDGGRYITCGFSAGGYLVCLWNTEKGYPFFELPKPQASFPVYPVTGLRNDIGDGLDEEESLLLSRLFGCSAEEVMESVYETSEHTELFPPCAIFLAGDDTVVDPGNSRSLADGLGKNDIPCLLEIGKEGGHGFADGHGMCMEGWIERALRWFESL